MLKSFKFTNWLGNEMSVSAYDIFDAEKQTIQILRVCDYKGDFDKALKAFKLGKLEEVANTWEKYYGRQ